MTVTDWDDSSPGEHPGQLVTQVEWGWVVTACPVDRTATSQLLLTQRILLAPGDLFPGLPSLSMAENPYLKFK